LARQLVAAGLADRPMAIRYRGLAETMTRRSSRTSRHRDFADPAQDRLRQLRDLPFSLAPAEASVAILLLRAGPRTRGSQFSTALRGRLSPVDALGVLILPLPFRFIAFGD
jgi:hypothetical protein